MWNSFLEFQPISQYEGWQTDSKVPLPGSVLSGIHTCLSSGCHRAYHRLGGLNSTNLFSTSSRSLRSEWSVNLASNAGSLPGLQMATFLLCAHMAFPQCLCEGRERVVSLIFIFVRALIQSDQSPIFMTSFNLNDFFRGLSPKTAML